VEVTEFVETCAKPRNSRVALTTNSSRAPSCDVPRIWRAAEVVGTCVESGGQ